MDSIEHNRNWNNIICFKEEFKEKELGEKRKNKWKIRQEKIRQ